MIFNFVSTGEYSLVFSTMICMPWVVEILSRRSTKLASSFSFPAKPNMSSAKLKFLTVLLPMLTVSSWTSNALAMIHSKKMLKSGGRASNLVLLQLWFWTSSLCCCWSKPRWWPYHRGFLSFWSGWHWCCTASWWPIVLHVILCRTHFWSPDSGGHTEADSGGHALSLPPLFGRD